MCGRFAVTLAPDAYRSFYGYEERPNFPPRYNVAPTQPVAIVFQEGTRRHFRLVRWGFLPAWIKDPKTFPLLFNARTETVLEKATFRGAMRYRRCVFLADGFYEWRRDGAPRSRGAVKTPFLIRRRDRAPLPLAGLWETYADPAGGEIDTAAICTTDANGLMAGIHDRMPVILSAADVARWLDVAGTSDREAATLMRPCPSEDLEAVEVSRRVNTVTEDDAALQEPVAALAAPSRVGGQGILF